MSNKVIYFYSKFSQSCKLIQPYIQQIANNINLQLVDIDNSQLRDYIESLNVITSVPCIIMIFPTENRLEIYEGNDVIAFINKVLTLTNRSPISNLNNSAGSNTPQIPNMRVNSPSTVGPSVAGKTQLNLDEMGNTKKPSTAGIVRIDDPFSEMAEQNKPANYKNMYAERLQAQEHIKKGEGHEGMGKSSLSTAIESNTQQTPLDSSGVSGATPLDFGDNYASDSSSSNNDSSLIIQKSDVNISDMHGNSSTTMKELDTKSEKIKSSAASMLAEREAFESSLNTGRR